MRLQRGQSMTEFAVGMAVLALLMLGPISLAGYQEVQRRAIVAARQAAFEGAWLGTRETGAAITARLFRDNLDDPGLTEATGHARYVREESLRHDAARGHAPGRTDAVAASLVNAFKGSSALFGGNVDLERGGYAQGTVTVQMDPLSSLPQPFSALELTLQQPYALLTDAWNASGPVHVRSRAAGLVPGQRLAALSALWRPLLAPLTLLEPSIGDLCPGLIEPERIPEDRLGPGRGAGAPQCH